MGATTASEPPSVSLSFANNFWGKDDAGVGPMLDRMHFAKVANDELKNFYAARAAIEEEYSRKLLNLSRKPLGSSESGTLKLSCDVIRGEVESMGKAHQSIAQQMKTELEEPLAAFAGGMKERRKIVQNGIEKLLKLKMQQTGTVNKARDRYEQDCLKIKGFLAQAHMVMGQEERKNKAKLEKTQINLSTTSAEYEAAVKVLEETTGRWNRDWKAACDKFQDLEEERIDYTKSSLWNFANIASTVCVSDDASCEKMRLSLEDCDVEKDITGFIKDLGTGQEIPDPPKFINFCRGDAETSSQVSDDENYSVAQFARTMNPSYRASSPQPSMFESHHDPNNPLAKELGLQHDTQPIPQDEIEVALRPAVTQDQINVTPRQSQPPPQDQIDVRPRHSQPPPQDHIDVRPRHSQRPSQDHIDHIDFANRQSQRPNQDHVEVAPRQVQRPSHDRTESAPRQSQWPPQDYINVAPRQPAAPQPVQPVQAQRSIQPDPRLIQAQQQARQHYQQSQVPHNDYPTDGMTQYCRIGPPSDRSTIPSPVRPSSRDSQSEYSNPTSFSSIEPPSGSASPGKPMPQSQLPEPSPIEESSVQKKRGFFNSPFARRKSKHEKEPPVITPSARNTWAPTTRRTNDENVSPTRPFGRGARGNVIQDAPRSASPEPVDPRANFQLNVGNNVFDVASPDKKRQSKQTEPQEELDPIAQALEELKGVTKQTSLRVSADRYHGLATPQPPPTPAVGANLPGGAPTPLANVAMNAAKRGTPPPSYEQPSVAREQPRREQPAREQPAPRALAPREQPVREQPPPQPAREQPPMSRLGAPKPAHTARQMQKTTQMYVNQKTNMYNSGADTRASSRSPTKQEPPRAASPAPPRAKSPRPTLYTQQSQQQASPSSYRGVQPQQAPSPTTYRPQQQQQQPPQPQSLPQQQRPASRQQQQAPPPQQQQSPAPKNSYRTASPNPYATPASTGARPRAPTATAPAQAYGTPVGRNSYSSVRGSSPSVRAPSPQPPPQPAYAQQPQSRPASRAAPASRAVSPQPAFRQQSFDRPSSSHSSKMAMSVAAPSERGDSSVYGGSVRGRGTSQRPQSSYYGGSGASEFNFNGGGGGGGGSSVRAESRVRSKSLAEPKQYNRDGRIILNYSRAMYGYAAQIPEELGFQKGDILAVLRLQDDGWWEAEAVGKNGRPGLVPSNYLQAC
ncbi:hypothetical protein CC86DRAFT_346674 [Ophiobolus disseminans]|uniref:SH3 domain-containing protein n=1 Tax=Ophiobolus disseminans TaxID=1469910 RepID=A0A6A7A774_9PLEO|nr:hypothetical protein CC86DRAFT_346674 [Ophiobolus disseminans]